MDIQSTLISAGQTFLMLFGELFALFIGISFLVALLQVYVSKERIKRLLTRPHKVTNALLGAALGAVPRSARARPSPFSWACSEAARRSPGRSRSF